MELQFTGESALSALLVAGLAFLLFLAVAGLTNLLLRVLGRRYQTRYPDSFGNELIHIVRGPIELFFLCLGIYIFAMILTTQGNEVFIFSKDQESLLSTVWKIVVVFIFTYVASKVSMAFLGWYLRTVAQKTESDLDDRLGPMLKRVLPITIYAVGFLVALEMAGQSISPLLAGLGIAGLAVALALQPTLGNFFAGTYVISEGEFHEGNYIELEGGPSGFIVDIGWRSTKIRSVLNNLVIIPNSTMADSIITNYYSPTPILTTIIDCGVSYESDLERVEEVSLEIAKEEVESSRYGYEPFVPLVRFHNFGDSNVDFRLIFQSTDRGGSFAIKHQIIKRLHARFTKEGIEINYPVRKLMMANSDNDNKKECALLEN